MSEPRSLVACLTPPGKGALATLGLAGPAAWPAVRELFRPLRGELPQTPEAFTYDADGNLLTDGRWNYTWDAENRLIQMVANTGVAPPQRWQGAFGLPGRAGPGGYVVLTPMLPAGPVTLPAAGCPSRLAVDWCLAAAAADTGAGG